MRSKATRTWWWHPLTVAVFVAMAALALPAAAQQGDCMPKAEAQDTGFADVPAGHWAYGAIGAATSLGLMTACGSGYFCPGELVPRDDLAVFLVKGLHDEYRLAGSPPQPPSAPFLDVPVGYCLSPWIAQLAVTDDIGFSQAPPCGAGSYCPHLPVTRAEAGELIGQTTYARNCQAGADPPTATTFDFTDISTHWARDWIQELSAHGVLSGCIGTPGGEFNPDSLLNRAEMACLAVNAFSEPPPDCGPFTLTVNIVGTGTVTSSAPDTAITCPGTCQASYTGGTTVTLDVAAGSGYVFGSWTECDSVNGSSCDVTVSAATTVTAAFVQTFTLTVTKDGTGSGSVTSGPEGIDCGSICDAVFETGASVALSAAAAAGSTFSGWSGGGCSGTGSCVVVMTQARSVNASFIADPTSQTLTVTKAGTGGGLVTSAPSGINCGGSCSASFDDNEQVTLTAAPDAGSAFAGWSGDCSGSGTCDLTMDGPKSATATFNLVSHTLTVSKSGEGTVTSDPAGINCGSDCSEAYTSGTGVTLTATPASGFAFAGWSGDCTGAGQCALTMDGAKSVTATFSQEASTYTLTVTKNGDGTVTSSPGGILCGSTCSFDFSNGASVTLAASPATGSEFVGWSGDCSGTGSCIVTMSGPRNVTASFSQQGTYTIGGRVMTPGGVPVKDVWVASQVGLHNGVTNDNGDYTLTNVNAGTWTLTPSKGGYTFSPGSQDVTVPPSATGVNFTAYPQPQTLTVAKAGTGGGTVTSTPTGIDCGSTCSSTFDTDSSVTVSAAPAAGSTFVGWSGSGCSGTGTCVVTMSTAQSVTATFDLEPVTYALSVTKAGTGTGTVTSTPAGIDCGATCSAGFDESTSVTLTATADSGSTFTGWSGAGCSGSGTCVVTMSAAQSVSANFDLQPVTYTLTVSKAGTGTGTVTSTPAGVDCGATCVAGFDENSSVTLVATEDAGSTFAGWSGAGCSGAETCVVTMSTAQSVTATFDLEPVTYTLTVNKAGTGTGTVTSIPAGVDCGATCVAAFGEYSSVALVATEDAGSTFAGWSGAGCSGTGSCVVTMSAAQSVTATFTSPPPPAPTNVQASNGTFGDRVQVSWDSVTGATGYEVWHFAVTGSVTVIEPALLTNVSAPTTSFDDLTAASATVHVYWVKAVNAAGTSPWSFHDTGWYGTMYTTPSGVTASDGTYTTHVQVSWNYISYPHYLWRNDNPNLAGAVRIWSGSGSTGTDDTTAAGNTTYWYWVKQWSDFSTPDTGYRAPAVPAAPTSLAATDGSYSDRVRLTWTASAGAIEYEVWRNTTNDNGSAAQITTTPSTAYDDTTVTLETVYWYWVKAVNAEGASAFSNGDSGYSTPAPSAPTGVAATDGSLPDRVQVTWSAASGATSYEVWRNTINDSGTATQIGTPTIASFDDTTAVAGSMYWYWIKAVNGVGASGFSAGDSGSVGAPATPVGLQASDGTFSDRVQLTWTASTEASGYEVWRNTTNDSGSASLIASPAASSCDDTAAVPDTTYHYWVRASNGAGTSDFSTGDTGYVTVATVPDAPTGVTATQGTTVGRVTVSWNGVPAATGYEVWRRGVDSSTTTITPLLVASVSSSQTSYADTNVLQQIVYLYWVKAAAPQGTSDLSLHAQGWPYSLNNPLSSPPPGFAASDGAYASSVQTSWGGFGSFSASVWRATGANMAGAVKLGTTWQRYLSDTSPVPGTVSTYWVRKESSPSSFGGPDTGFAQD